MGVRRGEPVERPAPWDFIFGDLRAAKGWEQLCRAAPGPADEAWVAITSHPTRTDQRQHQLKGALATGRYDGSALPQWQYEVTGAGRVWYLVDVASRRLVLTHAGPGHPSETDRGKVRRKR
jgi:hypothetical protein